MKARLFTVVIRTGNNRTQRYRLSAFHFRATTDYQANRVLGRLQSIVGPDIKIRYREQGAAYRTFDRQAVIRRCGGYREYQCLIGRSVL